MKNFKLFVFILFCCHALSQNPCDSAFSINLLKNDKLSKLWYTSDYKESKKDDYFLNKTIIYSDDDILINIIKCSEKKPELLLDLFSDSTKDYAANIALYILFKRDARVLVKFYFGTDKIDKWRKLYKEEDLLNWRKILLSSKP